MNEIIINIFLFECSDVSKSEFLNYIDGQKELT